MLKAKILALSMLMFLGWKPKSIYFFFFFNISFLFNCKLQLNSVLQDSFNFNIHLNGRMW